MFDVTHQRNHLGLQNINRSYLKFPVRYVISVLGSDDCCLGFCFVFFSEGGEVLLFLAFSNTSLFFYEHIMNV